MLYARAASQARRAGAKGAICLYSCIASGIAPIARARSAAATGAAMARSSRVMWVRMVKTTAAVSGSLRTVWRSTRSRGDGLGDRRADRLKPRRAVDDAPVQPPNEAPRLQLVEEPVDRPRERRIVARDRRMDVAERAADLVGEPPARRRAERRTDQDVPLALALQQAEILLRQPAAEIERMERRPRHVPRLAGDEVR